MTCKHDQNHSCVRKVPIFEHLTAEESQALSEVIQTRQYKKGEFIFHEGEKSDTLFVLNQGTVKISKLSENGKEQIIRFLFTGDFFGQFALLQEKKHYANAEVLDPAVVCCIHKRDFHNLMELNSKMAYHFLLAMSERLQQADEWMGTISLMETERRLAKLMILFYEKNNTSSIIRLPVQKKELAALLGTTPETLSRKLAFFEEQGILSVDRKMISIKQPDQLREYAKMNHE